jgi:hypothetical protein
MRHILLARGVLALGLPAFALSMSATPAFAGQRDDHNNHHSDTVKVKVCKKVVGDRNNDHSKDRDRGDNQKFKITVSTDQEDKTFWLKDGDCDWTRLDFDKARLTVEEYVPRGYELKDIKAWGDVKDVYFNDRDDAAKIRFDKGNRHNDPEVNVLVINKKKDRHDDHNHH